MNGWVRDSLPSDPAHDNPLHKCLQEEEKVEQSGQVHGNGGGYQPAEIDDTKLAAECLESEDGNRRAGHPRGQIEDGPEEGDAAPVLIKQQRQQQCEERVKG